MPPKQKDTLPRGSRPATILLVSPVPEDHAFLAAIFELPGWKTYLAQDYREARKWLVRDRMAVIICESHLPDGSWKDILSETQVLSDPPYLIVVSRLVDDLLWAEVINLGGYHVLAKPFAREEVLRTAEIAAMKWQCQAQPENRAGTVVGARAARA